MESFCSRSMFTRRTRENDGWSVDVRTAFQRTRNVYALVDREGFKDLCYGSCSVDGCDYCTRATSAREYSLYCTRSPRRRFRPPHCFAMHAHVFLIAHCCVSVMFCGGRHSRKKITDTTKFQSTRIYYDKIM